MQPGQAPQQPSLDSLLGVFDSSKRIRLRPDNQFLNGLDPRSTSEIIHENPSIGRCYISQFNNDGQSHRRSLGNPLQPKALLGPTHIESQIWDLTDATQEEPLVPNQEISSLSIHDAVLSDPGSDSSSLYWWQMYDMTEPEVNATFLDPSSTLSPSSSPEQAAPDNPASEGFAIDKQFRCTKCKKSYSKKGQLGRHMKNHKDQHFLCPEEQCGRGIVGNGFPRRDHLVSHLVSSHKYPGDRKLARFIVALQLKPTDCKQLPGQYL